jgi:methyl-accepting chemotaxis protein
MLSSRRLNVPSKLFAGLSGRRLTVRTKLFGGFGVAVGLLLIISALAYTSLGSLYSTTRAAEQSALLNDRVKTMEIAVRQGLYAEVEGINAGVTPIVQEQIKAAFARFSESLAEARKLQTPEMAKNLDDVEQRGTEIEHSVNKTLELLGTDIGGAQVNRDTVTRPALEKFLTANEALQAQSAKLASDAQKKAKATSVRTRTLVLAIGAAAIAIAGLLAFLISRPLVARVGRLRDAADRIGEGDLAVTVGADTSGDELGAMAASFEAMAAKLRHTVGTFASTATQLGAHSQQMASTSEHAGRTVNEIASSIAAVADDAGDRVELAQTLSAMAQEMASAAQAGAENAKQTAEAAEHARALSEDGAATVEAANATMEAVQEGAEAATATIRALGMKSEQIGGIVETITGIAGQTNLLALNAAIEAARAGEQGRGFAVVAEEVRKLAEESQTAAASIGQLIREIQGETQKAVAVVEEGATRTRDGASTVERAREAFLRIGASVEDVNVRIEQIAASIEQIAASSDRMQERMIGAAAAAEQSLASTQEVSVSTQETAASTQQIAASAQELARTAEELERLVGQFRFEA